MRSALVFLGLAVVAAGCGGSSGDDSVGSSPTTKTREDSGARSGGSSNDGGGEPDDSPNAPGSSGGGGDDASTGSGSGGDGGSESSSGGSSGGSSPTMLPTVAGTCPTIATGNLTFAGEPVEIFAGSSTPTTPGALVLFWYPTFGNSDQVKLFLGADQISAITAAGGIVASFGKPTSTMIGEDSNKMGTNTGDFVWYTGDFGTADQVVACAIKQKRIDPKRIFAMGASAGALQTTWMSYARSGYLAAVATLSGGLTGTNGVYPAYPTEAILQDSTHIPPALVIHGNETDDVVAGDNFADGSAAWESDIAKKGGFSIDCNTGGKHVSGPPATNPAIAKFFDDHPFGVVETYSNGLGSPFPSYCKIGPQPAK